MNYLGIDMDKVENVVQQLNTLLSNYHLYYQNLRNFHWNIKGENFFELHNQFETMYNDARLVIDVIAERILTLKHGPLSKFSDYIKVADIQEAPIFKHDRKMVLTILENHKILISNLREVLNIASEAEDEGTVDMASSFLESLEKKSWMLDAWATQEAKTSIY